MIQSTYKSDNKAHFPDRIATSEAINATKRPESLIDCFDTLTVSLRSFFQVDISSSINFLQKENHFSCFILRIFENIFFLYFIICLANFGPKSINCIHKRLRISCIIEFDV